MKIVVFALIVWFTNTACGQPQTIYPTGKWSKSPKLPKISYRESTNTDTGGDPDDYRSFGREVEQIISKMREVAVGRERDDLRVLEFRLREYNQAVSSRNWSKADSIRDALSVQLNRGSTVASDAGRRKAAAARADAERRHEEQMRQKERQHREEMSKLEEIRRQQLQLELLRRRR